MTLDDAYQWRDFSMPDNEELSRLAKQAAIPKNAFTVEHSPTSATGGERLDHLMVKLLADHQGLFLGENHFNPALVQSVTHLLPSLKSAGVATLSLELSQKDADAIGVNQSYEEYAGQSDSSYPRQYFDLVQAAKGLGIKVIGHEADKVSEDLRIMRRGVRLLNEQGRRDDAAELQRGVLSQWISATGVNERNAWANDYIRKHSIGKTLVIGGELHSGNYREVDVTRDALTAFALKSDYQGLDTRLGYPSINFRNANRDRDIGTTMAAGKLDSFIVRLPSDLHEQGITSWPPASPGDNPIPFEPFKNLNPFPTKQPPQPANNLGPPGQRTKPGSRRIPEV